MVSSNQFEFSFDFPFFLFFVFFFFLCFLLLTCCCVWLYYRMTIDLFLGFRVGDLDGCVVSVRHRSHIKFMFICMFYHI